MTMTAEEIFIDEFENVIGRASADRRSVMVHKVADLFVGKSDELSEAEISLFDDVIIRLASDIEQRARILLARRLAPIRNAPPNIIRVLAFDDAIEVAGPVLTQSARLDDRTLIEIVKTKGQAHLRAVSQRGSLNEGVTDALIELGDREVLLSTLDNFGANFTDWGFSQLVERSEGDDTLVEFVGSRPEIPSPLLAALVAKASQAVCAKLEAAHPRAKAEVQRAVADAAGRVGSQAFSTSVDYTLALASVEGWRRSGQLNEPMLAKLAKSAAYPETIVALATMCNLPIQFVERAMARDRSEALIAVVRAAGLSRSTAHDVLRLRAKKGFISQDEINPRLERFERLQSATAQAIVQVFRDRMNRNAADLS